MEKELLLLGILRKQDMHGYQMAEFIDHYLALCTDLKKATAYFLLDKMAAAGWITYEQTQEGKRPPRRVCHLTAAGEAAFQRLLRENLATYQPATFSGDIGLGFLEILPQAEARHLLEQRREEIEKQGAVLGHVPTHPGTLEWMIEHQKRHLAAEAAWVDELILRLAHSELYPTRPDRDDESLADMPQKKD